MLADIKRYKYFVWLNSSVRGPYLPAYLRSSRSGGGAFRWVDALTSRLSETVKLVGPTINCGGAYDHPPVAHVQSYAAATDQAGLGVMRAAGVFGCYDSIRDVVLRGELGASEALMAAGYAIDSLQLRYQGVDWHGMSDCNGGINPLQLSAYDGINVDPLEVMFVKVKASMQAAGWGHVVQAAKYDAWLAESAVLPADRGPRLSSNAFIDGLGAARTAAERRGVGCFDWDFYVAASSNDLAFFRDQPDPAGTAWGHFLDHGLREGRPYRFTC